MSSDTSSGDATVLGPDSAFGVLGHELRIEIVKRLGRADDPLAFSELYDEVDVRDSAQFNYHLDKLVGHFVAKTDDGYELRRAGERIVEAVLSGAVTDDPVLSRTEIDQSCPYCGAPVEVEYGQEQLASYCTSCDGSYGPPDSGSVDGPRRTDGYLGYEPLPPAGLRDRSPTEVRRTAHTWNVSERLPAAEGVCPRCSAPLAESVEVCDDHDHEAGLCEDCGHRHAVRHTASCTNCIFSQAGAAVLALLSNTDLLSFLTDHGVNPVAPTAESAPQFTEVVMDYEETVVDTAPLDARLTFTLDGGRLTLTVDEDLSVVEATRSGASSNRDT
jgi:hypothetical protein